MMQSSTLTTTPENLLLDEMKLLMYEVWSKSIETEALN